MVRQTDRPVAQKRAGASRRGPRDKSQAQVLCGWNLPIIPDANESLTETPEEEQYRHIEGHCDAIENKALFDRQSLHHRFLKHTQFGVNGPAAPKDPTVTDAPPPTASRSARAARSSHEDAMERSCLSAGVLDEGKDPMQEQSDEEEEEDVDEEDEEEGEEEKDGGAEVRTGIVSEYGRDSDTLLITDCVSTYAVEDEDEDDDRYMYETYRHMDEDDEREDDYKEEDGGWDEGYGSKVSSNDQEEDMRVPGGAGDSGQRPRDRRRTAFLDSGHVHMHRVGPVLGTPQFQPLPHQNVISKLLISRRERILRERSPRGRRMRGSTLQYMSRKQSRLMEVSLKNITPAYLARSTSNHLAGTGLAAQQLDETQGGGESGKVLHEEGEDEDGDETGGGQSRTLVLHKITIQDSGKELFSQNIQPSQRGAMCRSQVKAFQRLCQPFDRLRLQKSVTQRSASEAKFSESTLSEAKELSRSCVSEMSYPRVSEPAKSAAGRSETSRSHISENPTVSGISELPITAAWAEPGSAESTKPSRCDGSSESMSGGAEKSGSGGGEKPKSGKSGVSVKVHDLNLDVLGNHVNNSAPTPVAPTPTQNSAKPTSKSESSAPSTPLLEDTSQAGDPSSRTSPTGDKMSSITTFPMLDLLPAVEHNIRVHRIAQRHLSKTRSIDITSSLNSINARRQHHQQQQQPRHHHRSQSHQMSVESPARGDNPQRSKDAHQGSKGAHQGSKEAHQGSSNAQDTSAQSADEEQVTTSIITMVTSQNTTTEDVRSFPAFRAPHHPSPLQRAREIAERRIHGDLTPYVVSETAVVPSPRFTLRAELQSDFRHPRIKSASRFPPLHGQQAGTCCTQSTASTAATPRALATSLASSHNGVFTMEDMTAKVQQS